MTGSGARGWRRGTGRVTVMGWGLFGGDDVLTLDRDGGRTDL